MTMENAKRDGVRVHSRKSGSQAAGAIRSVPGCKDTQLFQIRRDADRAPVMAPIPVRYEMTLNDDLSREGRYATLVHELAHLYCGHLGSPNERWWPNRRGLSHAHVEFEAESVTYLVCTRLGIDNPSAEYLSNFAKTQSEVPDISLECVMKVAGLIEDMGEKRMKAREKEATSP
ncbi:MAG: hypothetical protein K1X67_20895 [Fimbriimonadaceae bacterium]|nr:hypothetical protein [Fimbriimonadaceae bacterium]